MYHHYKCLVCYRSPHLFSLMFRNSLRAVDLFNIPAEKFVEVGRQIEI